LLGCDLQPWESEHAAVRETTGAGDQRPTAPTYAGPTRCTQCVHSFVLAASPWSVIITDALDAVPPFSDRPTSITATSPVRPPAA
jgi:hypothetical protein